MPVASGILGKADLNAGALTQIFYNSSVSCATVNIIFCNRGVKDAKVRVAIIPAANAGVRSEDFIVYDQPLPVGSTYECMGVVIGTQETIFAYSSLGAVSVRIHGFVDDRGPALSDIGMATYNISGLTRYAKDLDPTRTDLAATPALVKAFIDAYGGGSGDGSGGGGFGQRITQITTSTILSGTNVVTPEYMVGANKINVFINGLLVSGGTEADLYAYAEVGNPGAMGKSIKFHDSYPAGTEISVIV